MYVLGLICHDNVAKVENPGEGALTYYLVIIFTKFFMEMKNNCTVCVLRGGGGASLAPLDLPMCVNLHLGSSFQVGIKCR